MSHVRERLMAEQRRSCEALKAIFNEAKGRERADRIAMTIRVMALSIGELIRKTCPNLQDANDTAQTAIDEIRRHIGAG